MLMPLAGHEAQAEALARRVVLLPAFLPYALSADALLESWRAAAAAGGDEARIRLVVRGGEALGIASSLARGGLAIGAYLRFLAVVPEGQRQGLGDLLLADFETAYGTPRGGWFVLTGALNIAAQAFYRRRGYREVGRLPGLVRAGVEERLWWKPRGGRG